MFFKKVSIAILAASLLVTACKEDEVVPGNSLTAKAGDNQNVKVGQTVTLDGSASADSESKPFEYAWVITAKPATSTAVLKTPTAVKASFVPDKAGNYELELTIKNGKFESKDKVTVKAALLEPLDLDSKITVKTTLEDRIADPDAPDYIAKNNVEVSAELTLKPGVVIGFARDTRMEISTQGGVLIAKGDSVNKIRFIGMEKNAGFWTGLVVRSASSANVFEYVEILHTGSKAVTATRKAALSVMGGSKAQIAVKNSLFEKNQGYGLYAESGSILAGFSKNTFKDNAEAGILIDSDIVKDLDFNSSFSNGNGRNVIEVMATKLSESATSETVWQGFKDKTPYRLLGDLSVNASWKLSPGVILEISRGGRIDVDDPGYLNAKGTAASRIVIRGVENTAAFWRGLMIFSTSQMNQFEYVELSGGGSSALVSGKKTNIAVYGSQANLSIKNSQINNSGGYGIYVNYQAKINGDVETSNTFTGNAQAKTLQE